MASNKSKVPVIGSAHVIPEDPSFHPDAVFDDTVATISDIRERMSALLAAGKVRTVPPACRHLDFKFIHSDPQEDCPSCQQFDICLRKVCLACSLEI